MSNVRGHVQQTCRIIAVLVVCAVVFVPGLAAQETGLALRVLPGACIPIAGSRDYFELGATVDFVAEYRLPALPFFGARIGLGYQYLPIWTQDSTQVITVAAGPSVTFDLSQRIESSLYGIAGYHRGFLVDGSGVSGGNGYLQGGLRAALKITPNLLIELDLSYRNNLQLSQGLSASVGTSYRFLAGTPLELREVTIDRVFPVLFKFYDERPIGTAVLVNPGSVPIGDISVDVFVEEFMVNPRRAEAPSTLQPDEEARIDLYALFADNVLQITEGTRVSAQISVSYTLNGESRVDEHSETVTFLDRNAITWDDDRKVAAYVTAKDPNVLQFARSVAAWAAQRGFALNSNLQKAIAIMEALRLHGITYVIDPQTPYAELSASTDAVDFLQFPQQTLRFVAGDCDDLCILYSAMLESVGVETAFVTTPGHISLAVSLGVTADEARRTFRDADDLVYEGGKVWLPIEVTSLQRGFDRARTDGARRFRQHTDAGEVSFYPTHEAWATYEPVGFAEPGATIVAPEQASVLA
ncbi:MAG: transglutaminase family protein, partial [Spirochaetaceae bacterium]|nr:transglutaminase family protein [Spirochaetaceae bacterium]